MGMEEVDRECGLCYKQQQSCGTFDYVEKPAYDAVKRVMNVVRSVSGLIILSPVSLGTAISIYIDDPAPVLFKQTQIGKSGKPFKIYWFRSMRMDAENLKASLMSQK